VLVLLVLRQKVNAHRSTWQGIFRERERRSSIMRQLSFHLIAFIGCAFLAAAQSPPSAPGVSRFRPIPPIEIALSTVTLYEDANFGGRSKSVSAGDYRLSDFEGIASSIKVPQGFVAILYEHADQGGGYGISVDLLEDCPDLSKYNLNDKGAYISVFSATRDGFFWARNSMQNGQFSFGHWERNRAAGNPVNTVAVASPPLPPHAPTGPTITRVKGGDTIITSLGVQAAGNALMWEHAETDQMGVIGSDFRGPEEIGSAAFERASHNHAIPDSVNFWYPQKQPNDHRSIVYFKRTLSGTLLDDVIGKLQTQNGTGEDENDSATQPHISNVRGTYEDLDLNLDIKPAEKYLYLITEAHKPEMTDQQKLEYRYENFGLHDPTGEYNNPCTNASIKVEAEIDAHDSAKCKLLSFLGRKKGSSQCPDVGFSPDGRIGKQIVVYGPWIYDKGHCCHSEIHPAEQVWWSEDNGNDRTYHFNLFCDASKRFWWRNQMDDGTKLKPWGAPPIKGTFALAFEADMGKTGKKFELSNIDYYNVIEFRDADKTYNLVYQDTTVVSFLPHNNAFKVSFENVGLKPGTTNILRGFLVLETSVGRVKQIATALQWMGVSIPVPEGLDPDKIDQQFEQQLFEKAEGHYMFSVLRSDTQLPLVRPVRINPGGIGIPRGTP